MKIVSWNVNGLKACIKKVFVDAIRMRKTELIRKKYGL